jgi:hypothetical protein
MVRAARLPRTIGSRCAAKAVLLALADRCDDDGENAWPSVATIAAETESNERTVQECLRALREHGLIAEQARPRQHRPYTYRLNLATLTALSGVQESAPLNSPEGQESAPLNTNCAPLPAENDDARGAVLRTPGVQVSVPGVQIPTSGVSFPAPDPVLLNPSFELSVNSPLARPHKNTDDEHADYLRAFERSKELASFATSEAELLEKLLDVEADSPPVRTAAKMAWLARTTGHLRRTASA